MPYQLPPPADIVRSSAATARRIAASFRCRGGAWYADHLDRRAAEAERRADYLDEIARVLAVPGGLRERQLIAEHEAAVHACYSRWKRDTALIGHAELPDEYQHPTSGEPTAVD